MDQPSKSPNLATLLADAGDKVEIEVQAEIPIRAGRAWLVRRGEVELYLIDSDGCRHFLVQLCAGHLLYGLAEASAGLEMQLLALGLATELTELDDRLVEQATREAAKVRAAATALESTVGALGSAIASATTGSQRRTTLPNSGAVVVAPGAVAYPSRGICWVRAASGGGCLVNRNELALQPGEWMPVSRELWLHGGDAEFHVEIASTEQLVERGDALQAQTAFVRRLFQAAAARTRLRESVERDRLKTKAAQDASRLGRSVAELSRVIGQPRASVEAPSMGAASALLEACRTVGAELGLRIIEPPPARRGKKIADPLLAIAAASKARVRRVVLRGDWIKHDNGPLIAFRTAGDRPVALLQATPTRYEIHDPDIGEPRDLDPQTAAGLKPVAYMFLPSLRSGRLGRRELWNAGLQSIRSDVRRLLGASAAAAFLALITPLVSRIVFDEIIPAAEFSQLGLLAAILVVFAFAAAALGLLRGLAQVRVEARFETTLEAGLMDRVLRLPASFFRRFLAGDLAQRVLAISSVRTLLRGHVLGALLNGVFSIVSLGLIFYFDSNLALLAIFVAVILIAVILVTSLSTIRYDREWADRGGQISGLLLQLLTGIGKLRVAAAEQRAFGVWAEKFAAQNRVGYRAGTIANRFEVFRSVFPVLTSAAFFAAVYLTIESGGAAVEPRLAISTGTFIAVMVAFNQFLGTTMGLGQALISALQVIPETERLRPILDTPPEVAPDSVDPGPLSGRIEVSHVTFRYDPDGPIILDDVNLEVSEGQMVALVGPSGSGKSTVLRVLLGLEQPQSGTIYLDGQDLSALDIEAVRRQFGVVLQAGQLIQGNILTNINGRSSNRTLDDAWEAARMVGLDRDIEAMPMRMHTVVSEGGSTFSGGQRQRLMIARAIVHRPPILLLDEATSALDNRTQRTVTESLEALNMTRVVIAHRLSTIRSADRICVLEAGRVVQQGSFDELIDQPGAFQKLAKRQLL